MHCANCCQNCPIGSGDDENVKFYDDDTEDNDDRQRTHFDQKSSLELLV